MCTLNYICYRKGGIRLIKIAHIINPGLVPKSSDLTIAQPITFETMLSAQTFARERLEVELYYTKFADEAFTMPTGFRSTPDLTRSLMDRADIKARRKLAYMKDILDRLYDATNAEYLIYTNLDIGLQPYFYVVVADLVSQGYDFLVINRRTIPGHYQDVSEIPQMYAEIGEKHPGRDCFVFSRAAYEQFELGEICIGAPHIGRAMQLNFLYHDGLFKELKKSHLTFHIGDDQVWRSDDYSEFERHNALEMKQIMANLQRAKPDFTHPFIEKSRRRLTPQEEPAPSRLTRLRRWIRL